LVTEVFHHTFLHSLFACWAATWTETNSEGKSFPNYAITS
jgi:hypothetical protein